jgi:hypothetical protein
VESALGKGSPFHVTLPLTGNEGLGKVSILSRAGYLSYPVMAT